jgi:hypothetical protein
MNKKRTPCKFSIYVYYPSIILARISTFRYLLICSPDSKYLGIVIIPQLIEVACGTVLSSHCSNKVANEYSLSLSLSLCVRTVSLSLSASVPAEAVWVVITSTNNSDDKCQINHFNLFLSIPCVLLYVGLLWG